MVEFESLAYNLLVEFGLKLHVALPCVLDRCILKSYSHSRMFLELEICYGI